jgi:hypothetical protein
MNRWDKLVSAGLLAVLLASATSQSAAAQGAVAGTVPVELELVLAVDTSASVNDDEFVLQMAGIGKAFRHPEVIEAIRAYGALGVAVTLVQWSAGHQQSQSVAWHHVYDRDSAARLARAIDVVPRAFGVNTTAIGSALKFSAGLFHGNGYAGRRRTIDVSGDGRNNAGVLVTTERDRAVAAGVTVNGLAILNGDFELKRYFRINVIGGPRAFVDFGYGVGCVSSGFGQMGPVRRRSSSNMPGMSFLRTPPNRTNLVKPTPQP